MESSIPNLQIVSKYVIYYNMSINESLPSFLMGEAINEQENMRLLAGTGNHEAKLLTLAVIASQPDTYFSETKIYNELKNRQGEEPAWKLNKGVPFKYCLNSLEPIGAVVEGQAKGSLGPIVAYKASEFGVNHGLPLAGALLDWSLKNPDFSLIQIFGSTNSKSEVRSPEVRLRIYNELLTEPTGIVSYDGISDSFEDTGIEGKIVYGQLRDMANLGVLKIKSVQVNYNPLIKIVNPNFVHVGIKFDDLKPETKAIYRAMQSLHGQSKTEIDLNTLIGESQRITPNINVHAARHKIPQSLHYYSKNFPGLQLIDRDDVPEEKRTLVKLNPELTEPLTKLCSAVDNIFSGVNLGMYSKKASEIINDPQAFATLMAKVKQLSPNIVAQTEGREILGKRLNSIVNRLGRATLKEIRLELEKQGRPLTVEAARNALKPLVQAKLLNVETQASSATNRTKVNFYSPISQSEEKLK